MKKLVLASAVVALGVALVVPATSVNARSNTNYRESLKTRVCNVLEQTEIRAWRHFDQNHPLSVKRVQNRIAVQDAFKCKPNGTIAQQLSERSQFSTLLAALQAAQLDGVFSQPGNYTLFAPTNQAFDKLGSDVINAVLADIPTLTNILAYHVVDPAQVPNAVPSNVAVTLSSAPMLNGENVNVEIRNGKLFINDSQVVVTDLKTTNGIVHVIDTVLLP